MRDLLAKRARQMGLCLIVNDLSTYFYYYYGLQIRERIAVFVLCLSPACLVPLLSNKH